jgi:RNA polymerase sigma factor (sigma-70 family)
MNDAELLQRYARDRCEESFNEVVRRHIDLVFSAALRQLAGDRALAEEVTQAVFTDLARKAGALAGREILTGWLYTSVRFAAAKRVRSEQRRRVREEQAHDMFQSSSQPEPDPQWEQLQPVLDEAMHQLNERDREALLLRYFEGKPLNEVGSRLGVSPDAARMRLERALEKLRKCLGRKGVVASATAIGALMTQQAATAAPVGLAASVAGAALTTAAQGASALTIFEIIVMSKLKAAAVVALVVGVSVPLVMQHRANVSLKEANAEIAGKLAAFENMVAPIASENARLSNALAQATQTNRPSEELLRLRAEVAQLRSEARTKVAAAPRSLGAGDPLQETLVSLGAKVTKLRTRFEETPDKRIPELALVSDNDWLNAVNGIKQLETDEDYRQAMNNLRSRGKQILGGQMQNALRKFAEANDGMIPTDISQLATYLPKETDPALLQRYKINVAGRLDDIPGTIIAEAAATVDDEFDSRFEFHRQGTSSRSYSKISELIETAARQFARANDGNLPTDPGQVSAYLREPVEMERIKKFMAKVPPNIKTVQDLDALKRR